LGFTIGLRALGLASLVALAAVSVQPATAAASTTPAPAAATTAASAAAPADLVVGIALAQRGKRYAYGATGPSAFDCSGLVTYAYRRAGLAGHLGGGRSGYAMYRWFLARGLASTSSPQIGDIVVYGGGSHVGIYIGGGREISALNGRQGIRVTGVHALGQRFTAYLHTNLGASSATWATLRAGHARHAAVHHAKRHVVPHAKRSGHAPQVAAIGAVVVRAGESTGARALGVIGSGTRLRITGSGYGHGLRWYRVAYRGHVGWVAARVVRTV
jgi:hypothetical protein